MVGESRSGFPRCPTQSYTEEWNAEANQREQWEHEDPENQRPGIVVKWFP